MRGGVSRRAALTGLTVSALAAPWAGAHRARSAVTSVTWVEHRSAFEVIHRLHAHDAEVALAEITGAARPTLDDLETRARLALYVEARFSLAALVGEPIVLTLLGAEMEGLEAFVYQEALLEAPPRVLELSCAILRDVFADQINLVNVSIGGEVRSARFSGDDESRVVRF